MKLFRETIEFRIDLTRSNTLMTKTMIDKAIEDLETYMKEAENIAVPFKANRTGSYEVDASTMFLISLRNCLRRQEQRKQVILMNRMISKKVQDHKNEVWLHRISQVPKDSKQLCKFTKILTNKTNKIPPLKTASNQLILTDFERAEEIGKALNVAHYTTYKDHSEPLTESTVKGSSLLINFLTPEIHESDLPTPRRSNLQLRD